MAFLDHPKRCVAAPKIVGGGIAADSDDCDRGFRLKATTVSDRRRPRIPIEGGQRVPRKVIALARRRTARHDRERSLGNDFSALPTDRIESMGLRRH
jgi:hypothetical protein